MGSQDQKQELSKIIRNTMHNPAIELQGWFRSIIRFNGCSLLWGTELNTFPRYIGWGIAGITTQESTLRTGHLKYSYLSSVQAHTFPTITGGKPDGRDAEESDLSTRTRRLIEQIHPNDIEVFEPDWINDEIPLDSKWDNWFKRFGPKAEGTDYGYGRTHDIIVQRLRSLEFASVLSIGCASGELLRRIIEIRPGISLSGVERNRSNYQHLVANTPGLHYRGDFIKLTQLVPKQTFDLVICCGALAQYVVTYEDAVKTFDQIPNYMHPGSYVLLAGATTSHIEAEHIQSKGFRLLQKCVPQNIFDATIVVGTKQLYLAEYLG